MNEKTIHRLAAGFLALWAPLSAWATPIPEPPRLNPDREVAAPTEEIEAEEAAVDIPAPPKLSPERPGPTLPPWMRLSQREWRKVSECRQRLGRSVAAKALPIRRESALCGMAGGVELTRLGATAFQRPAKVGCFFAERLIEWRAETLNPLARRIFHQDVAYIVHYGGYSCRRRSRSGRISAHNAGRALDIAGFVLSDGTRVRVLEDWGVGESGDQGGREAAFLAAVLRSACRHFSTAIGPDYDAAHEDHFHFDASGLVACR